MKIISPSATIMEHSVSSYEFIERVGRTCYRSEDKITDGSAEKFVKDLIDRNHWAMLEHETVYIATNELFMRSFLEYINEEVSESLAFFNITFDSTKMDFVISGSFRSFHDLFNKGHDSVFLDVLKYVLSKEYPLVFGKPRNKPLLYCFGHNCFVYTREAFIKVYKNREDILFRHLTHTVRFVCDRGVSHEMVRHRVASFAQESTRYCNYSKGKYGSEITVIRPYFFDTAPLYNTWKHSCEESEKAYFKLLDMKATPQEARSVLPNSLKTELIVTATEEEWRHIVNLRLLGTTGAPHPQIKEVMSLAIDGLLKESGGRILQ